MRRSQITVGDFNGDGWLDAATANPEPGRASVFRNDRVWPHLDAPSLTVGGVPLAELRAALTCGVAAVDLRSGQSVGLLEFRTAVEEIFDVQIFAGLRSPEVVGFQQDAVSHTFFVPGGRGATIPAPERPAVFAGRPCGPPRP